MSDIMANSKPEGVQLIVVKLSFGLGGVKQGCLNSLGQTSN